MSEVERDDVLCHFIEVGDLNDCPVVGPVDDVGVVVVLSGGRGTSRSDYSLSMKFPIFASAFIFENSIIKPGKQRRSSIQKGQGPAQVGVGLFAWKGEETNWCSRCRAVAVGVLV